MNLNKSSSIKLDGSYNVCFYFNYKFIKITKLLQFLERASANSAE